MPAIPLRRLKLSLMVGAAIALTAIAMPTAANAADACVPGVTPTPQTQPWLDYANSTNYFVDIEASLSGFYVEQQAFAAGIVPTTTQVEFDAGEAAVVAAQAAAQADVTATGNLIDAQFTTLKAALAVSDPANQVADYAIIDGWSNAPEANALNASLSAASIAVLSGYSDYLTAIQAALTASQPVPVEPTTLVDAYSTLASLLLTYVPVAVHVYFEGARAQVVFACPAALAKTGLSDSSPVIGSAAAVLLGGAALVIFARRRREV